MGRKGAGLKYRPLPADYLQKRNSTSDNSRTKISPIVSIRRGSTRLRHRNRQTVRPREWLPNRRHIRKVLRIRPPPGARFVPHSGHGRNLIQIVRSWRLGSRSIVRLVRIQYVARPGWHHRCCNEDQHHDEQEKSLFHGPRTPITGFS